MINRIKRAIAGIFKRQPRQIEVGDNCNFLLSEYSGRVWAETFVQVLAKNPAIASDVDTMQTWFASAIMTGYDKAHSDTDIIRPVHH